MDADTRMDGKASFQDEDPVARHWAARLPSLDAALAQLKARGIDPDRPTVADLHRFDMVHIGGISATDAVAEKAGMAPGHRVLDVGCGLGGPARRFAVRYGADVDGIEISDAICRTARELTARVGLADRVRIRRGSATELPYADAVFDIVVIQHCAMQVPDKPALFGQCHRVLKPGGRLLLHDFFSGDGGEPEYPLVWGDAPSLTALQPMDDARRVLAEAGFEIGPAHNQSTDGVAFYARLMAGLTQSLEPGAQGPRAEKIRANLRVFTSMIRNLRSDRFRLITLTCVKP